MLIGQRDPVGDGDSTHASREHGFRCSADVTGPRRLSGGWARPGRRPRPEPTLRAGDRRRAHVPQAAGCTSRDECGQQGRGAFDTAARPACPVSASASCRHRHRPGPIRTSRGVTPPGRGPPTDQAQHSQDSGCAQPEHELTGLHDPSAGSGCARTASGRVPTRAAPTAPEPPSHDGGDEKPPHQGRHGAGRSGEPARRAPGPARPSPTRRGRAPQTPQQPYRPARARPPSPTRDRGPLLPSVSAARSVRQGRPQAAASRRSSPRPGCSGAGRGRSSSVGG